MTISIDTGQNRRVITIGQGFGRHRFYGLRLWLWVCSAFPEAVRPFTMIIAVYTIIDNEPFVPLMNARYGRDHMNADSLHAMDVSLSLMAFSALTLAIIGVLMLAFQVGILRATRRNHAAMLCILCRTTKATKCYIGYKIHCDDAHDEKQGLEERRR